MPPRRTRRTTAKATVTRRRRTSTTAPDSAASRLMGDINGLIAENATLRREVERLQTILGRVGGLVAGASAPAPRRGRPPASAAPAAVPANGRRRAATAAPKPRRRITDPVVLEKRRQALAKARAARAEKLKARRAG